MTAHTAPTTSGDYARRYAGTDAQYDALYGANARLVSVSDRDDTGRRTVVIDNGERTETLTTDADADLPIGAGKWLRLDCTTKTAARRVALHLADQL